MKTWIVDTHYGSVCLKARAYYLDAGGNLHLTDVQSEPVACFLNGQWLCVVDEKHRVDFSPRQ